MKPSCWRFFCTFMLMKRKKNHYLNPLADKPLGVLCRKIVRPHPKTRNLLYRTSQRQQIILFRSERFVETGSGGGEVVGNLPRHLLDAQSMQRRRQEIDLTKVGLGWDFLSGRTRSSVGCCPCPLERSGAHSCICYWLEKESFSRTIFYLYAYIHQSWASASLRDVICCTFSLNCRYDSGLGYEFDDR